MGEEWREVRRKASAPKTFPTTSNHQDNHSITSFYVCNLPGGARKGDIWRPCAKMGELVDIYIAGRRDAIGSFFAFVRYAKVTDPSSIEDGLNKLTCRGRKLNANCARHPRAHQDQKNTFVPPVKSKIKFQAAPRDSRSFADVIGGKEPTNTPLPTIPMTAFPEIMDWVANGMLVGVAKSFDMLCNFPSLVSLEGFNVCEIKYLGGMNVAIKCKSGRDAEILKANKNIWLIWFNSLEHFGKNLFWFERIAWIKPGSFWNNSDVSFGKMCILTACRMKVAEERMADLNGVKYKVGIMEVEDDWVPFNPFVVHDQTDSEESEEDDEFEEGVSDTWDQQDMDLEDEGIRQDDHGPADASPAIEKEETVDGSEHVGNPNSLHGEKVGETPCLHIPHGTDVKAGSSLEKNTINATSLCPTGFGYGCRVGDGRISAMSF
ncbi:hypothetical protein LXL04_023127 [Taraxacum kok-saghyz]